MTGLSVGNNEVISLGLHPMHFNLTWKALSVSVSKTYLGQIIINIRNPLAACCCRCHTSSNLIEAILPCAVQVGCRY